MPYVRTRYLALKKKNLSAIITAPNFVQLLVVDPAPTTGPHAVEGLGKLVQHAGATAHDNTHANYG